MLRSFVCRLSSSVGAFELRHSSWHRCSPLPIIVTSRPLRLAKFIMCSVPRLWPSQNAIRASETFAICALRTIQAPLPSAFHRAGYNSTGSPNSLANLSPRTSAPLAWPETMMTWCVLIFS